MRTTIQKLAIITLTLFSTTVQAQEFDKYFEDRTLRLTTSSQATLPIRRYTLIVQYQCHDGTGADTGCPNFH
jgi:hypothetical protein